MNTRWTTWLVLAMALAAAFPATTMLRSHAHKAWQDTRQEVGEGMHSYFDGQFRNSAF